MENSVNQSQLALTLQGFADDEFRVRHLQTQDFTLSGAYRFTLDCVTQSFCDTTKLCGAKAQLSMNPTAPIYIYGFIETASYLGLDYDKQTYAYQFVLASPLVILKKQQKARIFLEKNIIDIVKEILSGWDKNAIQFVLSKNYPAREFILQLNESDFDFFMRLLSEYGLNVIFKQDANNYQLLIFDDNRLLPPANQTLPFYSLSGSVPFADCIYYFSEETQLLPQKTQLINYSDQHPEKNCEATTENKTQIIGKGTHFVYGNNITSTAAAKNSAEITTSRFDAQRQIFIAETNCLSLQPGQTITLQGHNNDNYNTQYLIVGIDYSLDQKLGAQLFMDESDSSPFINKVILHLIKSNIIYRSPLKTREPFYHILPALIESPSDYAYLDDQGRYHVRFPFDQSNSEKGAASCAIRLLQPHGGRNSDAYGMHFPLRAGTQVAVGFIMGDLDRPVILGVIHNSDNPSPVNDKNNLQNCWRTFAGNELLLDDTAQNPTALLATKNYHNSLQLSAAPNNHMINLQSTNGSINTYANKKLTIRTGNNFQQDTGNNHTVEVGNTHWLMTKDQAITQAAAQNFLANAGNNLQLGSKSTTLSATKTAQLSAGNNLSAKIQNAPLKIQTEQNNLQICSAGNLILHSQGNSAIIGQPNGGITITPAGNFLLQGPQVCLEAPVINLYGTHVVNHGSTSQYTPPTLFDDSSSSQDKKKKNDEDEFNLFVATVYGEAAGCSEAAWKAVGSVIVNRLSRKEYKRYKTITQIIQKTKFQAYDRQSKNFVLARSYLDKISSVKPLKINEVVAALKPVYYNRAVNTDADHYYSPYAQHQGHEKNKNEYHDDIPKWANRGLNNGTYIEVKIQQLNPKTDDFVFLKTVK